MVRPKTAGVALAVGVFAVTLVDETLYGDEHRDAHTPSTYFGTVVSTSTSALHSGGNIDAAFDHVPFRVFYPQAIEILTDEVSESLPAAPITFALS